MLKKQLMVLVAVIALIIIFPMTGVLAIPNAKQDALKAFTSHSGNFSGFNVKELEPFYDMASRDLNGDGKEERLLIPKQFMQVGDSLLPLVLVGSDSKIMDTHEVPLPSSFSFDEYNDIHLRVADKNLYKEKLLIIRCQDNKLKEIWSGEVGSYKTTGFTSEADVEIQGNKMPERLIYRVKQESFRQTYQNEEDTYTSVTTFSFDPVHFKFNKSGFWETRVPLLTGNDRSETAINKVQLGDSLSDIKKAFGTHYKKGIDSTFQEQLLITLNYPGIVMGIENTGHPYLRYFVITDNKYMTKREIKIGDTLDKVRKKYGEPVVTTSDWNSKYIHYKSTMQKDELGLLYRYHIRFYFSKEDLVNKIEIFDYDYGS